MITYSIINRSQLEGANRLDAEYFMPTFLHISSNLQKIPTKSLDSIADITASAFYPAATEFYGDTDGLPFIRGVDIVNYPIMTGDQPFEKLPINFLSQYKKNIKILKKGDIVVSKVGTPCYASLINNDLDEVALSRTVLGLKNIKDINELYLLAFLRSKYGFDQLKREIELQIQEQLTLERVRNIKIYIPSPTQQEEIALLIKSFYEKEKNSKEFYSQAEDLLLEELVLKDFAIHDDLSFVVNFSDVESSNRMDADYFQPKYQKLIAKIKEKNAKILTEVIENVPARFSPYAKPNESFMYVELANINSSIGIINGFSKVLGKEAPSRARRVLKTGDVIVSSVEGSLEKTALVDKEQENHLASTGFFQFRSKEILPEVILILAKSLVLQMQLQKECAGTILTAVPQDALKNIFIPVLPKESQQKIAELVRQSHEARKKSKQLLEEAKRKVEEMIEKGGDN